MSYQAPFLTTSATTYVPLIAIMMLELASRHYSCKTLTINVK